MKCIRYLFCVAIALFFPVPAHVGAFVDNINAVNNNGRIVDIYTLDEDIYISGECTTAANKHAEVFVVKNQSNWKDGADLNDITTKIETVSVDNNGEIPLTRIWPARLTIGEYDLVIDIDGDKKYDEEEDCVDDISPLGFRVINSGDGTARLGSKSQDERYEWNVRWDDPFVVMMQIKLSVDDLEDINITSLTLDSSGSGNEKNSIIDVIVAKDRGNNGEYRDGSDIILGSGKFSHDSGDLTVPVNLTIEAGDSENIIIVYLMGKGLVDAKTFQVDLKKILATGLISEDEIIFSGLPVESVVMEVAGTGDAQVVDRYENPEPQQDKKEPNVKITNDESTGLLKGIFSGSDEVSSEEKEEGGPPHIGFRVAFFLIIGFILLTIIWKAFKLLVGIFL